MGLFDDMLELGMKTLIGGFAKSSDSQMGRNISAVLGESDEYERNMMRIKDQELQREIIFAKADGSAYEGGNPLEKRTIARIITDYNEFDVGYAKGCVNVIADMIAKAFKDHPSDYTVFEKLCTKTCIMKIKKLVINKRINWFEYGVSPAEIIRYNPDDISPTVVLKSTMSFKPEEKYKDLLSYSFFYSCIEGAKTCPNCGGVIEQQLIDKCPYCERIVTDSATEKAWKITDIRRLN